MSTENKTHIQGERDAHAQKTMTDSQTDNIHTYIHTTADNQHWCSGDDVEQLVAGASPAAAVEHRRCTSGSLPLLLSFLCGLPDNCDDTV